VGGGQRLIVRMLPRGVGLVVQGDGAADPLSSIVRLRDSHRS